MFRFNNNQLFLAILDSLSIRPNQETIEQSISLGTNVFLCLCAYMGGGGGGGGGTDALF